MSKWVITGGAGFIGSALIWKLNQEGIDDLWVVDRLDRLTSALLLDRERARLWSFAQTLAWAFEDNRVLPRHVETARWLWQA